MQDHPTKIGRRTNITGRRFGRLTAIEPRPERKWLFRCDCGTEKVLTSQIVIRGSASSCGCLAKGVQRTDYTGQKFQMLTAVEPRGSHKWLFRCDCGVEKEIVSSGVVSGRQRSCGCQIGIGGRMEETHGMSEQPGRPNPTYRSWTAMRNRCSNPRNTHWPDYGGRGIIVCARWDSFEAFVEDLGDRPAGRTLGRIDNDGNYEPGNVRWETPAEQGRNTRFVRRITFQGETLSLSEWSRRIGITVQSLSTRLNNWPVERALTERRGQP